MVRVTEEMQCKMHQEEAQGKMHQASASLCKTVLILSHGPLNLDNSVSMDVQSGQKYAWRHLYLKYHTCHSVFLWSFSKQN